VDQPVNPQMEIRRQAGRRERLRQRQP
jgi:hypothetical protein